MPPDAPLGTDFAAVLETCRHFLLAVANAELPADLRAKGGASDLVQESLAAAHAVRHQFRGRTLSDLRAWLRAILRNELGALRRRYRDTAARDVTREVPLCEEVANPAEPVAELVRRERNAELAAALTRLPEDARLAVALRIEHELPFAEIGARIGRTEEAARKVFARALADLRMSSPRLTG
jgi:RNA polymerase sigma-70 factor (ECF subfamily)